MDNLEIKMDSKKVAEIVGGNTMNFYEAEKWNNLRISKDEAKKITREVIEVFKENNLSLNQINAVLDLVKDTLKNKPLWD